MNKPALFIKGLVRGTKLRPNKNLKQVRRFQSLESPCHGPHLRFCVHERVWLLHLIPRKLETKEITVKTTNENWPHLQEHNFQKNNKISLHHAISIISMALKMAEAEAKRCCIILAMSS